MTGELWTSGVGLPRSTVCQARQAETEGWDGLGLVDPQNLAGDPLVELALPSPGFPSLQQSETDSWRLENRFSVMHLMPDEQGERLDAVHGADDHGFGIAGPVSYCIEKILELEALGIRRISVMGGGIGLDREEAMAARQRFVSEVLPVVRS